MSKKVIVIGLDGLEPTIVESMLQHGELPNLARIRQMGSYSRLKTTYPAQTPVAWSSFATGTNPGGHGIFDFISRDPATYLPDAALSHFERPKNLFAAPQVVNQRKGKPFWQTLSQAGVPSIVLRCPCTFPPDDLNGHMIAGVGVPDSGVEAGAPEFIDLLTSENPEYQLKLGGGLAWLDSTCTDRYGKPFLECPVEQRKELLDLIAYRKNGKQDPTLSQGVAFFAFLRNLTCDGFYTSKIGIADLGYIGNESRHEFPGCPPVPVAQPRTS